MDSTPKKYAAQTHVLCSAFKTVVQDEKITRVSQNKYRVETEAQLVWITSVRIL
jgi:hypothetical protein